MNASKLLAMVTLSVFTATCGGSSTTVEKACVDFAQAQCGRREGCTSGNGAIYPDGVYVMANYGDLTTCRSRVQQACINNATAPGTGTSPDQVEKCAVEYAGWACADLFDNAANPPPDCSPPGKLANGQTCAFAGQCASRFCAGTKNATCGQCADPPVDGASCATSACAPGQSCRTQADGQMLCRDRVPAGDPTCTSDRPCQSFTACVGASSTDPSKPGVCTVTSTSEGIACGGGNPPCEGNVGLACLGANGAKTCQRVAYARAPAACGAVGDERAACINADCFTATGPAGSADTDATCVAQAADGNACDTQVGPLCLPPARCVTTPGTTVGTCIVPAASLCP